MIVEHIRSSLLVEVGLLKPTRLGRAGDDRLREPFLAVEVGKLRALLMTIELAILDRVMPPAFGAENPLLIRRRTVNYRAFGRIFPARVWQTLTLPGTLHHYEDLCLVATGAFQSISSFRRRIDLDWCGIRGQIGSRSDESHNSDRHQSR